MLPQQGSYISIEAYKHDGHIRRIWDQAFVLFSSEEKVIAVTNKTWVQDDDGHRWYTREPALCYFYSDSWFNVIAMLRETGIFYYCNLASPWLYDGEAIKYIDYDLDYKFMPDGSWHLLDEEEYRQHSQEMNYPPQLDGILHKYMQKILDLYREGKEPFNAELNEKHFEDYLEKLSQQTVL